MRVPKPSGWEPFYEVVRRIPRGRVTTYGVVAALAGRPGAARQAGYALAALRGTGARGIPWQRVMGKRGRDRAAISLPPGVGGGGDLQRELLEAEGVRFDRAGGVSLAEFGWPAQTVRPAAARTAAPRRPRRTPTSR
jgi:methylated-DNA-protein-cysteine methyltransferase-like protein